MPKTHFELSFECGARKGLRFIFLNTLPNCSSPSVEDYPFSIELALYICSKSSEYILMDLFLELHPVPLIYISDSDSQRQIQRSNYFHNHTKSSFNFLILIS
jgi:hypothetical protein